MKAQCPNCDAVYQIDDSKIPSKGTYVTCTKCKRRFPIKKQSTPTPPKEEPQQKTIICPKCGHKQNPSETCLNCSIVFAKYHEIEKRKEIIEQKKEEKKRLKKERRKLLYQKTVAYFSYLSVLKNLIRFLEPSYLLKKTITYFSSSSLLKSKKVLIGCISLCIILSLGIMLFFFSGPNISGGAWVIRGGGQSDILRGLEIYILKERIERSAIADILVEIHDKLDKSFACLKRESEKDHGDQSFNPLDYNPLCLELILKRISLMLKSIMTRDITAREALTLKVKALTLKVKEYLEKSEYEMLNIEEIYKLIRQHNQLVEINEYSSIRNDELWPKVIARCMVMSIKTDMHGKYKIDNLRRGNYCLYSLFVTKFSLIEWFLPLKRNLFKNISQDLYNNTALKIINKNEN